MGKEIICAGFGGQGVLTAGMLLINAGMEQDKNVLFYPSYGSEMRGGTANCTSPARSPNIRIFFLP